MKRLPDIFRPRAPAADAMGVLVPALVLTGLGLICVFSFGGAQVLRQAVWAACGVAACVAVSRIPLDALRRVAVPALVGVCLFLLAALLS